MPPNSSRWRARTARTLCPASRAKRRCSGWVSGRGSRDHGPLPRPCVVTTRHGEFGCPRTAVRKPAGSGQERQQRLQLDLGLGELLGRRRSRARSRSPRRGGRPRPRRSAQRSATQNSPSSARSVQPTAPAYQPRSRPSSAGISGSAASRGSPPTAGVGQQQPGELDAPAPARASWARIGVARCWTLWTLTSTGSSPAATQRLTGSSARSIRRATIACSSRSFGLCRSCSPRWSSTAGSALRRVVPASATVWARCAVAAHEQLRAGADERELRRADAPAVAGREDLAQPAEDRRRVVRRAPRARAPRARARPSRARPPGCARPRALDGVLVVRRAAPRSPPACARPGRGRAAASPRAASSASRAPSALEHRLPASSSGRRRRTASAAPRRPGARARPRAARATPARASPFRRPAAVVREREPAHEHRARGRAAARDRGRIVGERAPAELARARAPPRRSAPAPRASSTAACAERGEREPVPVGLLEAGEAVVRPPRGQHERRRGRARAAIGTVIAASAALRRARPGRALTASLEPPHERSRRAASSAEGDLPRGREACGSRHR